MVYVVGIFISYFPWLNGAFQGILLLQKIGIIFRKGALSVLADGSSYTYASHFMFCKTEICKNYYSHYRCIQSYVSYAVDKAFPSIKVDDLPNPGCRRQI